VVILITSLGQDVGQDGGGVLDLGAALAALGAGIVGTAFCVAVHVRARAAAKARRDETNRLVAKVRAVAA
jgi:hypothetical protein